MLSVRVASAIVGLVLLIGVVSFGNIALGIAIFLLTLIGMYEYYNAVSNAGYKPIRIIGYLACLPILFIGLNGHYKAVANYISLFKSINYFSFTIFIFIVVLFSITIFMHDKYNLNDISLTVFGIFYVVFLFSFVVLTRNVDNGKFFIWLVFIGAWATDTFAYFAGRFFGRRKLLPAISPKKTVEGAIGGVIGCIAITVAYGLFINRYVEGIAVYNYVILGLLNGIIAQIGDWAASAIKRYVNIKDYGKIMPGHGGVLDRFDSILFIAPVVYFYLSFIIIK
ncbi:MAG: phosphatidate cytidylyltransferase [Clostridia bacterium]|nr:phosphatidate cytidylyltransferase [Clostridia bacterium]